MRAKRFVASSLARTLETVVAIITGVIMMPLMIRILGENLYGIWIVVGSIVGSLYLFDIGMSSSVTRFIAYALSQKDRRRASQVMSTAFAIYSALSLIIILTAIGIALCATFFVESPENTRLVQILILIVGLNVAVEFPFKSYAGIAGYHLRQDLLSYSRIAFKVISTLIVVWLLFEGYQLIAIALVQMTSSFFSNLVFRFIARYLEPEVRLQPRLIDKHTVKEIFGFSAWAFIVDLTRLLKERGDVWIVAAFTTPALLTVYYVGVRLVDYANEFLNRAFGFTLPIYTEAVANNSDQELAKTVSLFLRLNTIAGSVILLGAYTFGEELIRFWMGKDFDTRESYGVMTILLTAKFVVFIFSPYNNVLFAIAKHRYQAYVSILEAGASFALILLLLPLMDRPLIAASLAIATPFFITRPLVIPFLVCKNTNLRINLIWKTLAPLFSKISLFSFLWILLENNINRASDFTSLIFEASIFLVSYGLVAYAFFTSPSERTLLHSIIKKTN